MNNIITLTSLSLFIVILTVGCAGKRPCGEICLKTNEERTQRKLVTDTDVSYLYQIIDDHIKRKVDPTKKFAKYEENVISLSAGGQYGAFGAGFTVGWFGLESQNVDPIMKMPRFNIVTSVSIGSLLAPFVFLLSGQIDNDLQSIPGTETKEERIKKDIIDLLIKIMVRA